jgi:uncharacterized HAD superfamily protein
VVNQSSEGRPSASEEDLELRLSDHLVRLVQIVFGLVVTQSLVLYREVVTDPFGNGHWMALLALASVYMAVIWSWFDWHEMMARLPYKVRTKSYHENERRRLFPDVRDLEKIRFVSDLAVVTVYAYLLFSIERFKTDPGGHIGYFLLGYVLIALTYLSSGTPRQMVYGWQASNTLPILQYLAFAISLTVSYFLLRWYWSPFPVDMGVLNVMWLAMSGFLTFVYRRTRRKFSDTRRRNKAKGKRIGVDVDGVLGDQIYYILPILKTKFGVDLAFKDIVQWDLPVGDSDIAVQIRDTMIFDPEYALGMPRHKNARRMLKDLFETNIVVVVTARPKESSERTTRWLLRQRLPFDEFENAKEALKSEHDLDVLVDDYPGNVKQFLEKTDGVAILVDRPWNQDRESLEEWIPDRLQVVTDLGSVPVAIGRLTAKPGEAS